MNRNDRKKLRLNKETLRSLAVRDLAQVAGASAFCVSNVLRCTAKCDTGGFQTVTCLSCVTCTCPTETK